jgi:hypothetical protein
VLAWLRCKARQALAALAATSGSSIAALDPQQQLGYALGFLSEYLSPAWHARLVEHCGVQPIGAPGGGAPAVVLKPVSNEQPAEKKPKVGSGVVVGSRTVLCLHLLPSAAGRCFAALFGLRTT